MVGNGLLYKNKIVGWAALSPVSKREVYKGVAEVSIYITSKFRGKGIGRKAPVRAGPTGHPGERHLGGDPDGMEQEALGE